MQAIISSTYDSKYLFFLPITTWCWNKLGVDVICFMPEYVDSESDRNKYFLALKFCHENKLSVRTNVMFNAPKEKEATYAQCSRLYAACLDIPEDEILITSDVDMAVFELPDYDTQFNTQFSVFGVDLVPKQQYPICYLIAKAKEWRYAFEINGKSYQEKLDDLLGNINAEHFRGNYWGKDQEEAFLRIVQQSFICTINRSNGQNQFATRRLDRDDAYILERDIRGAIDFHMPRPGYETANFNIIFDILSKRYPNDDLQWMKEYQQQYKLLL